MTMEEGSTHASPESSSTAATTEGDSPGPFIFLPPVLAEPAQSHGGTSASASPASTSAASDDSNVNNTGPTSNNGTTGTVPSSALVAATATASNVDHPATVSTTTTSEIEKKHPFLDEWRRKHARTRRGIPTQDAVSTAPASAASSAPAPAASSLSIQTLSLNADLKTMSPKTAAKITCNQLLGTISPVTLLLSPTDIVSNGNQDDDLGLACHPPNFDPMSFEVPQLDGPPKNMQEYEVFVTGIASGEQWVIDLWKKLRDRLPEVERLECYGGQALTKAQRDFIVVETCMNSMQSLEDSKMVMEMTKREMELSKKEVGELTKKMGDLTQRFDDFSDVLFHVILPLLEDLKETGVIQKRPAIRNARPSTSSARPSSNRPPYSVSVSSNPPRNSMQPAGHRRGQSRRPSTAVVSQSSSSSAASSASSLSSGPSRRQFTGRRAGPRNPILTNRTNKQEDATDRQKDASKRYLERMKKARSKDNTKQGWM